MPPEFPPVEVEEFAQETELWKHLSRQERAMLGPLLYEAWDSLWIAQRGMYFSEFAITVVDAGLDVIRFLSQVIHEERQHLLAHRAATSRILGGEMSSFWTQSLRYGEMLSMFVH